MAISIEHRFYGGSIPNNDRSTANLKYLTVEQNLADTAFLLEQIQKNVTLDGSKPRVVINFGGSYSGATSAWFREKYPTVTDGAYFSTNVFSPNHASPQPWTLSSNSPTNPVHRNTMLAGAVSSSGVVNAIWQFENFDKQVAKALDLPTPGCADKLRAVTAAFDATFATGSAGAEKAKTIMNAVNLIDTTLGDADFWYMIADSAAMADQYGAKAGLCTSLLRPYTAANGTATATPTNDALMKNFANFTMGHYGADFPASCFYDSECLKNLTRTVLVCFF
jgi:hypothetical protein